MQPITIQYAVWVRKDWSARWQHSIIHVTESDGVGRITVDKQMASICAAPIHWIVFNKIDQMDSFEMVVDVRRGRCASFMIRTTTVSEIFGGQTNSSILVVYNFL